MQIFTWLIVTLWAIWFARRNAIHEDIHQSPISIHHFVNSYIAELNAIQVPKASQPIQVHDTREKWLPPETSNEKN